MPPDGGGQLRTEAQNFNWRTQVVSSEQSVEDVLPVVQNSVARAQDSAAASAAASASANHDLSGALGKAKELAEQAQAEVDEATPRARGGVSAGPLRRAPRRKLTRKNCWWAGEGTGCPWVSPVSRVAGLRITSGRIVTVSSVPSSKP